MITIPKVAVLPVEGCEDLVYTRDDMTNNEAWFKLAIDHDMNLHRYDFINEDDYRRYFLLASGLMDYACAIITGSEGEGKSLGQAVLTYRILNLFKEKRGTLDWSPPKRVVYGTEASKSIKLDSDNYKLIKHIVDNSGIPLQILARNFNTSIIDMQRTIKQLQAQGLAKLDTVSEFRRCDRLVDEHVIEKLRDEVNEVSKYEDEIPQDVLDKLLVYNRVFGLDECDRWGDKGYRTNLTKLVGRIINRRRHYHTSFLMVYIDPKGVDGRYIWDRRTHRITVEKVGYDECEYRIYHERTKKTHWMTLHPSEWVHLWDTHNISAVSSSVSVDLGSKNVNRKKREETKEV